MVLYVVLWLLLLVVPDHDLVRREVRVLTGSHQKENVGFADHLRDFNAAWKDALNLLDEGGFDRIYPKPFIGRNCELILILVEGYGEYFFLSFHHYLK